MKMLLLTFSLLSFNAFASGCMPDDVQLVSETAVVDLGQFETTYNCDKTFCGVSVWNQEKDEYHQLALINEQNPTQYNIPKGKLNVKIYDQYFVSSCTETHRYVLGMDLEKQRYREVDDLREL